MDAGGVIGDGGTTGTPILGGVTVAPVFSAKLNGSGFTGGVVEAVGADTGDVGIDCMTGGTGVTIGVGGGVEVLTGGVMVG